jgi:chromosomal replication initiation ATPase DnaA
MSDTPAGQATEIPSCREWATAILACATVWKLRPGEIASETKEQPACFARQVSWWLLSDVLEWSTVRIGRLTDRSHGTIQHAITAVKRRIETEPLTVDQVIRARGLFLDGIAVL